MNEPICLSYLFDPLCGWCYGAAPGLEELMTHDGFIVELVPTGLFAGAGAFQMNERFAAHAWSADQRIAALSGQDFSEAYRMQVLSDWTSRVDSGPATLALTAVHLTAPRREFEALKAIQHARYVSGMDNGKADVVAHVLRGLELNEAAARFEAGDDDLRSAYRHRIGQGRSQMQLYGLPGVPALIAKRGSQQRRVDASALFGRVDRLITELQTL